MGFYPRPFRQGIRWCVCCLFVLAWTCASFAQQSQTQQETQAQAQTQTQTQAQTQQISGANVNMVSGTQWPGGDPFLQRQNEPSIAVSSRNPFHLLAGANDYRSVDLALTTNGETGDAWLGLFKSLDGGATWRSVLLPGCPYNTPICAGAPSVQNGGYAAAADPMVRAGSNGMFYYSGLVFDRGTNPKSAIIVSRFIDLNNKENADPDDILNGDAIQYVSTSIAATGNASNFFDKPTIAVDVPRRGAQTCRLSVNQPGNGEVKQTFAGGNVYVTYTDFEEQPDENPTEATGPQPSRIYFVRSTNCGATWSKPLQLNGNMVVNQGTSIAIDPVSGAVYVAWREFAYSSGRIHQPDAIVVAASFDGGESFLPAIQVSTFTPFDEGTTNTSFRTNAYPSITVDNSSRVYIAYSARNTVPSGDARIVLNSSLLGLLWNRPVVVDNPPINPVSNPSGRGHQIMPALTFAGGKLSLLYYDLRLDHTYGDYTPLFQDSENTGLYSDTPQFAGELALNPPDFDAVFNQFIDDSTITLRRHTFDLRVTQAPVPPLFPLGKAPVFSPSILVSQYAYGCCALNQTDIEQMEFNAPNLPMFQSGTVPFMGDYVDLAPAPLMLPPVGTPGRDDPDGDSDDWHFNTSASTPTTLHASWTDNRDVQAPPDGDWTKYTPPLSPSLGSTSIFQPGTAVPACQAGYTGTRNQNIYTAPISDGLVFGAPSNAKTLGTTVFNGQTVPFQRAFVVVAQNTTQAVESFRLTITNQPAGGSASFLQFSQLTTLDLSIAPLSSESRPVFVVSTDPTASVTVTIAQITAPGGTLVPSGLTGTATLNPDATNPAITNPAITNPGITNPGITNFEVTNPAITNPAITNPAITNPGITNPAITNPGITNAAFANESVLNPGITNPGITNPAITNASVATPGITNPGITNTNPANVSIADTQWTVTNTGNTTGAYTVNLASGSPVPPANVLQLIISKLYQTPAVPTGGSCNLAVETHNTIVTNIVNPALLGATNPGITNPGITNPAITNATVSLDPGETANIIIRVTNTDIQHEPTFNPASAIVPVVVSQSVNTQQALASGGTGVGVTPPISVPPLIITNAALPDGVSGVVYSVLLQTQGGNPTAHTFSISAGALPAGLTIGTVSGAITGVPTAVGTFTFTVQVQDVGSTLFPQNTGKQTFTVHIAPLLSIITTTLPGGTVGTGYSQTIGTNGGLAPLAYTVAAGALPPGLILNAANIAGTPTTQGTFSFTIEVADSSNPPQIVTQPFTVTIAPAGPPPLAFTANAVPAVVVGRPYNQQLPVTGGVQPYTATQTGGTLPPGIGLTGAGMLTGTASGQGAFIFTVSVSDSSTPPQTVTQRITIAVNTLVITTTALPSGIVGVPYNATISTAGGTLPLSFSLANTAFPPGLTIQQPVPTNGAVGALAGTPTLAGTFTFSESVVDSSATPQTATQSYVVTIAPAGSRVPANVTFVSQPQNSVGGQTLAGSPIVVKVTDANNTPIAGTSVALNFNGAPPCAAAVLGGTSNVVTDTTGQATFANLSVDRGQLGYTLQASAGSVSALSTAFTVNGFCTAKAPISVPRELHSAVTLLDGTVLVAGGGSRLPGLSSPGLPVASAELYNPSTGTFSATGSMNVPRWGQTTTLLRDGRVLITGGVNSTSTAVGSVTNTAEIYDPAAHTFTLTNGPMASARFLHTATLLADGRVLLAGGGTTVGPDCIVCFGVTTTNTAEIFDPATGLFTPTSTTLTVQRQMSAATLMPNGQVLLAGGLTDGPTFTTTSSAEIFDPVSNGFRATASMTAPRVFHDAALLSSGRVLIASGDTAELYDPAAGTFTATSNLVGPSGSPAILLTDGTVLWSYQNAQIYNGSTSVFAATGGLIVANNIFYDVALLHDGTVLTTGGETLFGTVPEAGTLTDTEIYYSTAPLAPLSITTTSPLFAATVDTPFTQILLEQGGVGALTWTLASGTLPPGITLSSGGILQGTPTTGGTFTFTVQLVDSSTPQKSTTATFMLNVTVATLAFTSNTVPTVVAGEPYSQPLPVAGGTQPYTATITSGALPPGIALSGAMLIGTASGRGTFTFTVSVTDSSTPAQTATQTITMAVNTLVITTTALPSGIVGVPYSATISTGGGTLPLTFSAATAAFPPGLAIQQPAAGTSTGTLAGTPTLAGTFTFSESVTDSSATAQTATQSYTVTIAPAGTPVPAAVAFVTEPQNSVGRQTLSAGPIVVSVTDASNNPVPGVTVAMSLTGSFGTQLPCPVAVLSGTLSAITGANGQATFSNLSIDRGAFGYNLLASTGSTSQFSGPFAVQGFCASGSLLTPREGHTQDLLGITAQSTFKFPMDPKGAYIFTNTNPPPPNVPDIPDAPLIISLASLGIQPGMVISGQPVGDMDFCAPGSFCFGETFQPFTCAVFSSSNTLLPSGGTINRVPGAIAPNFTTAFSCNTPNTAIGNLPTDIPQDFALFGEPVTVPPGAAYLFVAVSDSMYSDNSDPNGDVGVEITVNSASSVNGDVLIAGGVDNNGNTLNTAELYHPLLGFSSPTGNLIDPNGRTDHVSVVLQNGEVLLAGGADNVSVVNSAELYNPASGTFTATGSLVNARYYAAAVLLPDGRVLVSGGFDNNAVAQSTAEIYNPSTGQFSSTGNLNQARGRHAMTLLPNGKVLVTGGRDSNNSSFNTLASAEIFDPFANQGVGAFTPIGNMNSPRSVQTATLLSNGTVLVAGGFNGGNTSPSVASAEIFDPSTNSFTPTGSMNTPRARQTSTLLPDGTVLEAGGINSFAGLLAAAPAEIYSSSAGAFTLTGSMITGRELPRATLLPGDGNVLVSGGDDGVNVLASTEVYYNTVAQTPIVITTTALANGSVGQPYVQMLLEQNRSGPITWSLASGSLPPGITLSASGFLTGIPTAPGSFTFAVTVTDGISTATATFTLTVSTPVSPLVFGAQTLPTGFTGTAYSATLAATGGAAPYTFAVTSGTPPGGITLATSGAFSGTPTTPSSSTFTVTVTDSSTPAQTASQSFTINVVAPLAITTASLANGAVTTPYADRVSTTGGSGTVSFAVSGGSLPPGLTFNGTGFLSGTPIAAGSFTFTVTATDQSVPPQTASQSYTVLIAGGGIPMFVRQPQNSIGGQLLAGSPITVQVTNGAGTPLSGVAVTIGFNGAPSCASAILGGTLTQTSDASGIATFGDLTIDRGQSAYQLVANVPQAAQASSLFNVEGFCSTGTPAANHLEGTATPLGNGLVLVAGGFNAPGTTPVASAELYNPTTGVFTPTSNMTSPRARHTATLLNDGTVLIAGGDIDGAGTATSTAEIYNTATGAFTSLTSPMTSARAAHSAVALPNGTVLLSGGLVQLPGPVGTTTYNFVGVPFNSFVGTACPPVCQISGSFTVAQPLAPNLNQSIGGSGAFTPVSFSFTDGVTTFTDLNTTTSGFAVDTDGNGNITFYSFFMSGPAAGGGAGLFIFFDGANQVTQEGVNLNNYQAMFQGLGAPGGTWTVGPVLNSAEVYNPTGQTFTATSSPMTSSRQRFTSTLLPNGKVLLAGGLGLSFTPIQTAEIYDSVSGSFTATSPMAFPQAVHTATLLPNGTVALIGGTGASGNSSAGIEVFNPTMLTFAVSSAALATARSAQGGMLLPDGRVLVNGGTDVNGNVLSSAETFNFAAPSTALTGSMQSARTHSTATLLPNGTVLAVGGSFTGSPGSQTAAILPAEIFYPVANPTAISITTTSLANAVVGRPYFQGLLEQGGVGTLTWTLASGTLPPGITLNASGFLTGIPTAAGSFTFAVNVADGISTTTATFTLTVSTAVSPLVLGAQTLPTGFTGTAYNATLTASGGTAPYTFAVTSGTPPGGITLATSGAFSGTPTTPSSSTFTVTVTDSSTPVQTASQSFTINVAAPLTFSTTGLSGGTSGIAYTATLTTTGGTAPISFAVTSGVLPPGLTLTSAGVLSGTPTTSGTFTFAITATDSSTPPAHASQSYTVIIGGGVTPLVLTPSTLQPAVLSTAYLQGLTVSGGVAPYNVTLSGTLPAGITFSGGSSAPALIGTPTDIGTFPNIVVTATDSESPPAQVQVTYTLTVNPFAAPCESGNEAAVNGQYAFLVQGFKNGRPQTVLGSVTLNGAGLFTAGQSDTGQDNGSGGGSNVNEAVNTAKSSYSIGPDLRGCVVYANSSGITAARVAFGSVGANGIAQEGNVIEFQSGAAYTSGVLKLQNPAAFSTAAITGPFAYELSISSILSNIGHWGVVGSFTANNGTINTGSWDFNDTNSLDNLQSWPASGLGFPAGGTYTVAANGRGTISLPSVEQYALNGTLANATYIFYVVSPSQLLVAISPDTNDEPLAGTILAQTGGPFSSLNISGAGYVNGASTNPVASGAWVGAFSASNGNWTITLDNDFGGTYTQGSGGGTYSVASNGRVLLAPVGTSAPIAYIVSPNQLFMVLADGTAAAGSIVGSGVGVPASVAGTYNFGTDSPMDTKVTNAAGTAVFDNAGNVTFVQDQTNENAATLTPDVTITSTYAYNATTGRGVIPATGTTQYAFYAQTAKSLVLMNVTSTDPAVETLTGTTAFPSLALSPGSQNLSAGTIGSIGITLPANAPVGGVTVSLFSSNSNVLSVPSSIFFPAGSSSAAVNVTAGSVAGQVTLTASAPNYNSATAFVAVTIPPLSITTTSLPNGTMGTAYPQSTIATTGGVGTITLAVTAGALPSGLTLSSAGLLSGTPTVASTFTFTVTATDQSVPPQTASQSYSVIISGGTGTPAQVFFVGQPQNSIATQPMETAIQVEVVDATDTPLAGATVTLTFNGTPACANATINGASSVSAVTGSNGIAVFSGASNLTIDRGHTNYTLTATVGSVSANSNTFNVEGFCSTATPSSTRYGATSALLQNGKVLLAGGQDATAGVVATAEIYDPVAKTFTATGSMNVARLYPTATLLNDGTVLIVGGTSTAVSTPFSSPATALSSAEIYNPTTGQFTLLTAQMGSVRVGNTATLLNDGTVLIAGGFTGTSGTNVKLNTAEIYDPVAQTFTPLAATMNDNRESHTATLLASGKVLLAGGLGSSGQARTTADIYDPAAKMFTATAPMTFPHALHAAAVLQGGLIAIIGGVDSGANASAENAIDLFDATTNTFQPSTSVLSPTARVFHTGTALVDGRILIDGGFDFNRQAQSSAETFNGGQQDQPTSDMQSARAASTATLLQDQTVLFAGGTYTGALGSQTLATQAAEIFYPGTILPFSISTGDTVVNVNAVFSFMLQTIGGNGKDTWQLTAGSLPTGVTLSASGVLSGTPTTAGDFALTLQVTDSSSPPQTTTGQFVLVVTTPQLFVEPTLPDANPGVAYSQSLVVFGGTPPYTFGFVSGALPSGLNLASNGVVSGTTGTTGTFSFTVQVTDSSSPPISTQQAISMSVAAPLTITTASLPGGVVGTPYSATITATGGLAPLTFSSSAPPGLTLSSAGVLSGTPTTSGTFSFEVQVSDTSASPQFAFQFYNLTITGTPVATMQFVNQVPQFFSSGGVTASVLALDASNNPVANTTINLSVSTNPCAAEGTSSTSAVTDATGTATFGLDILGGGFGFVMTATSFNNVTATSSTFNVAGSCDAAVPAAAHYAASTTVLNNGQVLVAGGQDFSGGTSTVSASAELYNPTTAQFSSTGSMTVTRTFHTATLLPSGNVLIVGGLSLVEPANIPLASVEVYNTATGTFTALGSMSVARFNHMATLLNDGTVLVAGGNNGSGALASAEIINPTAGTITLLANSMNASREMATATLLPNSTVLIAGGLDMPRTVPPGLPSAEIYNPSNQTFTLTSAMNSGHAGHTATLLTTGKVLIAGGENVAFIEGAANLAVAELYDPTSGTFTLTGSLSEGRALHTATLLQDNKVLISGGNSSFGLLTGGNDFEIYDPSAGTFALAGTPILGRTSLGAGLLSNGTVLLVGGEPVPEIAEIYYPAVYPIVFLATTLRAGVNGSAYSAAILTTGGFAPVTFQVTGGSLPSGLTLSAAGVLSGTPTASGTFTFTVTATDVSTVAKDSFAPQSTSQSFTVTIN